MEQLLLLQSRIIEELIDLNKKIIDELSQYKAIDQEEELLKEIETMVDP